MSDIVNRCAEDCIGIDRNVSDATLKAVDIALPDREFKSDGSSADEQVEVYGVRYGTSGNTKVERTSETATKTKRQTKKEKYTNGIDQRMAMLAPNIVNWPQHPEYAALCELAEERERNQCGCEALAGRLHRWWCAGRRGG